MRREKEQRTRRREKGSEGAVQALRKPDADWLVFAIVVFEVSAFGLLAFRNGEFDPVALAFALVMPVLLAVQAAVLGRFFPYMDKYLFVITHFLCALGLIMLYRLGEDKAYKQFIAYGLGCAVQIVAMVMIARFPHWWKLRYVIMGASVVLLLLALVLGKEKNGAQNWIQISGFSMQPSEFIKAVVPLVLALYLARDDRLFRLLPAGIFVVICVLLLVLQRDLGAVLIYFAAAIAMYYAATSDWVLTGLGLAGAAGGAIISYQLFSHVRVRVSIWQNPWTTYDTSGYQIVQALMAIGSGGLFGLGLGEGIPSSIPVYDSDFIFAVICEEFGVLMGLCVLALYVLLLVRAGLLAQRARDGFGSLLAFGIAVIFAVQTFLIVGGVINMIPLTGVTLPFISNGGSSMIASLAMIGMLEGVAVKQGEEEAREWHRARSVRGVEVDA